jgi:hypothetical protein
MSPVSYQGMWAISSSQNFLLQNKESRLKLAIQCGVSSSGIHYINLLCLSDYPLSGCLWCRNYNTVHIVLWAEYPWPSPSCPITRMHNGSTQFIQHWGSLKQSSIALHKISPINIERVIMLRLDVKCEQHVTRVIATVGLLTMVWVAHKFLRLASLLNEHIMLMSYIHDFFLNINYMVSQLVWRLGYGMDGRRIGVLFPARPEINSPLQRSVLLWGPPSLPASGNKGLFPWKLT